MSQFDEKSIRKELFGILVDSDIDITVDDFNELMEEIMPVIEDVYYKGIERGKIISEQTMREIDVDIEKDIEKDFDLATIEDLELFSSEPE